MNQELDAYLNRVNTKEAWDEVWAMVKTRHNMFQSQQGRRFKIGDSVQFDIETGKHRGHYAGVITKMRTTSATIKTNNSYYSEWNMPYDYLRLQSGII